MSTSERGVWRQWPLTDLGPWNGLIDGDAAEVSVGRGHASLEYWEV